MKTKKVYKYKKGQKLHLDEIYMIQGLGSDWYEEEPNTRGGLTDFLVVNKDITITITIDQKE